MSYMSDATIVPRVQAYLEANSDKTYVDINLLADELQNKYKEYARRKRSAFRASVNRAYSIISRNHGLEEGQENIENETVNNGLSCGMDTNCSDEYVDKLMKKQLTNLNLMTTAAQNGENELIDISSDESENLSYFSNKNSTYGSVLHINSNVSKEKNVNKRRINIQEYSKKSKDDFKPITPKTKMLKKNNFGTLQKATYNFKNIGGMEKTLEQVCKLILHIKHPEIYKAVGISPPRGLLLHGPPGSGKTLLANAIAGELNTPLLKVAAPELVAGVSGESEERIRELFDQAIKISPCVLFIDEIDAITPNRQNVQKEMERRIVAQLISCLDDLNENDYSVLVIGASNRLDSIDTALRRAGRFDREISLAIPDTHSRAQILKLLSSNLKLTENFDFETLASHTPGFVGADLLALIREAAIVAINRSFKELQNPMETLLVETAKEVHSTDENNKHSSEQKLENNLNPNTVTIQSSNGITKNATLENPVQELMQTDEVTEKSPLEDLLLLLHNETVFPKHFLQNFCITMSDFDIALKNVQPSAKREGFATVPNITWSDIGSLKDIREELQMAIVAPVKHAREFYALGIDIPAGILLCGPPGCGKTLLAKAIANEAGINFISVKGPELLNMYVGESERAVRVCFERARNSSPCVIFFDELDALCPKRSDSREGSTCRVVNQMLTEMDGVEGRRGVFLLAATNIPDKIDPAVLRPGRLDKILYVGLPSGDDRVDILRTITKNGTLPKLAPDVNLEDIGKSEQCKGYTGADLAALVREASIIALKQFMSSQMNSQNQVVVKNGHFMAAISKIRPSVSDKDQQYYEKIRKMYTAIGVEEIEYS